MPPDKIEYDSVGPTPKGPEPDAHGQAALLLSESILHALVEGAVLSADDAVSVVRSAAEVKVEVAALTGETHGRMQASLDLLTAIARSFEAHAVVDPQKVILLRPFDKD